MALVVDTGPLYATLDRVDPAHAACSALLTGARESRIVPAPVLPELDFLCARSNRRDAFAQFIEEVLDDVFEVVELRPVDYSRAVGLLRTYADLRVGFVDAAVLAIVERLGESRLATLDHRHFGAMRPRHVEALELLPA